MKTVLEKKSQMNGLSFDLKLKQEKKLKASRRRQINIKMEGGGDQNANQ